MLYPANSLINRTISGGLYEVMLTSIGMFIDRSVEEGKITPQKLHKMLGEIYELLGKGHVFKAANISPDNLYQMILEFGMHWKIDPYDQDVTVQTMDTVTAMCEKEFSYKKYDLLTNDLPVSDPHVVGEMFMMRLMHDRYHIVAGSSIPRRDTRGHLVDKSTSKKDGRSLFGDKPTKICILTMDKILKTASNETCAVLLTDKAPLYGTHELTTSVGFQFETVKKIRNRKEVEDDGYED